jgi:magnesium transporter
MLWQGNPLIGLVVGGALLLNLINASVVGTLVPLGLRFCKVDPALASGVLVTTFTDVIGSICLYGLATLLIVAHYL